MLLSYQFVIDINRDNKKLQLLFEEFIWFCKKQMSPRQYLSNAFINLSVLTQIGMEKF